MRFDANDYAIAPCPRPPIAQGDAVTLRSGGPRMIVVEQLDGIEAGLVVVAWVELWTTFELAVHASQLRLLVPGRH